MRDFKAILGLAVLGVVCVGSVSIAKKIELPKHELKFEVVEDEPVAIEGWRFIQKVGYCPEYKVVLEFKTPTNLGPKYIPYVVSQYRRRSSSSDSVEDNNIEVYVIKDSQTNSVSIYSKSVDDVKRVAEEIVESLNKGVLADLQKLTKKVQGYKVSISELEKKISKFEQKKGGLDKSFNSVKRRVLYSKIEDAEGDIPNFIKQFSLSNIQIEGVEAKLRKIKREETLYSNKANVLPHIIAIRVAQEAELEGAKARKKAARVGYDLAMKFIEMSQSEIAFNKSLNQFRMKLKHLKEFLESDQKGLENPIAEMQFVELEGDVVKIRPVVCEK